MAFGGSSAAPSGLFIDDDVENLSLLLSGEADTCEGIGNRFLEDHGTVAPHWTALVTSTAAEIGGLSPRFDHDIPRIPERQVSRPAAFDTDEGKLHLKATSSILQVSDTTAVQLTLGALRSISTESSHYRSLLGTRELLQKVMEYHYRQRVARLEILAELLRAEQDDQCALKASAVPVLDTLDRCTTSFRRNRGIFRMLVSALFQFAHDPFSREQVWPAKELKEAPPSSLLESMTVATGEAGWEQFLKNIVDLRRIFIERERVQAAEALLALLYSRIDGGVQRSDYSMLLVASRTFDFFADSSIYTERLPRLLGLICVECMGLVTAFDSDASADFWVSRHPLLEGLVSPANDANQAGRELEGVLNFLGNLVPRVTKRRSSLAAKNGQVEAPEGLAVVSFGLLLVLAHQAFISSPHGSDVDSVLNTFQSTGLVIVEDSNDKCAAFDYLYTTMKSLVDKPTSSCSDAYSSFFPYDSQFFDREVAREAPGLELNSPSLAYASIGRELLEAVVVAFGSTTLSPLHPSAPDNLGMLSNLSSVIFRQSTSLCLPFWEEWEAGRKLSSESHSTLSMVLESSASLAKASVASARSTPAEQVLRGIIPLFQMVASVACSYEIVEFVLHSILKPDIIQSTLRLSSHDSMQTMDDGCATVLDSLRILSEVGDSRACRQLLRNALDIGGTTMVQRPRLLISISQRHRKEVSSSVFALLANLLKDAPDTWVMELALSLKSIPRDDSGGLFPKDTVATSDPVASIIDSLFRRFNDVAFSPSFDDNLVLDYISVLTLGLRSCCAALTQSVSKAMPNKTVTTLLDCLTDALVVVRTVIRLHASSFVRDAVRTLRDSLIQSLSSERLGEIVVYYAVLPVVLNLVSALEEHLHDSSMSQLMEMGERVEDSGKGGGEVGWLGPLFLQSSSFIDGTTDLARDYLLMKLSTIESLALDEQCLRENELLFVSDMQSLLRESLASFRLLLSWASVVEDIVIEDGLDYNFVALSPYDLVGGMAQLPVVHRNRARLSPLWSSACVTNLALMVRYLGDATEGSVMGALRSASQDFLFIALVHSKTALVRGVSSDDYLSKVYFNSQAFMSALSDSMKRLLSGRANADSVAMHAESGLRSVRLAAMCARSSLKMAVQVLGEKPEELLGLLCGAVTRSLGILGDSSTSLQGDGFLYDLRVATSCLELVAEIWKHGRSPAGRVGMVSEEPALSTLRDLVETTGKTNLLSVLAKYVFARLEADANVQGPSDYEPILSCALSLSLELLTHEICWDFDRLEDVKDDLPIVRALENAMEHDLARFVAILGRFVAGGSFEQYAKSQQRFSSMCDGNHRISAGATIGFSLCFSTSQIVRDVFFLCDATSLGPRDYFTSSLPASAQEVSLAAEDLTASKTWIGIDEERVTAWRGFSEFLSLFLKKWRDQSSSRGRALLSLPNDTLSMKAMKEISRTLYKVLSLIEELQIASSPTLLIAEALTVSNAAAGLLLHFASADEGAKSIQVSDWLDTINYISQCCKKFISVVGVVDAGTANASSPLPQLLASAGTIVSLKPEVGDMSHELRTRANDLQLELSSTASTVLRMIETLVPTHEKAKGREYSRLFRACTSLLAALVVQIDNRYDSALGAHTYASKLHSLLNGFHVIPSLVRQSSVWKGGASDFALILSALELLNAMSTVNDAKFLALLIENEVSSLLTRCTAVLKESEGKSSHSPESLPLRGYVPGDPRFGKGLTRATGNVSSGEEDKAHVIWRNSLRFLSSALRTSRSFASGLRDLTTRLAVITIDFMNANRFSIHACLQQCCAVSSDSNSPLFTFNVLIEATWILSVASELCAKEFVDIFQRECPDLYDALIMYGKPLLVSFASFLGASAASRELFKAMSDYESGGIAAELQLASLVPSYNLLVTSGVPNAKHEAIRFSRFASGATMAVTDAEIEAKTNFSGDWTPPSRENEDPSSLKVLEHDCQADVSNDLAFELEQAAADSLFFVLSMLWRRHPATSSFVVFSAEEVATLDALPLVRPGMVIAFRKDDSRGHQSWLVPFEPTQDTSSPLEFAEVLYVDTVNREWQVRVIGADTECRVRASDLAGIEDTTKQSCMLTYHSAPETSEELDASRSSASVGHLILSLRWCHQCLVESKAEGSLMQNAEPLVSRLSEISTAFLTAELSLHKKLGGKPDNAKALAAQIFDLFADEDVEGHRGRAKDILSYKTWSKARESLEVELDQARIVVETKNKSRKPEHQEWLGTSVRRSGHLSPFRRLSFQR